MADKTISVVLTVYNKADFLWATLKSLYGQEGRGQDFELEFVLVDDASRDASLEVSEVFFRDHSAAVQIIRNKQNEGPSVRLNQGMRAATGDYIFVFDADDIAPCNVLQTMLALLEREQLDYVYGRSQKVALPADEVAAIRLPEAPAFVVSDDPLQLTLDKGIVLPIVLVRREVALRSGGCDDKVFVQDESLALHLSLAARRIALLEHPCRYVLQSPDEVKQGRPSQQHLSANLAQQHHDQFLTYTRLLERSDLTPEQRVLLAKKAVAPWWKSARGQGGSPKVLFWYLLSKAAPRFVLKQVRQQMDEYFAALPNVRRIN